MSQDAAESTVPRDPGALTDRRPVDPSPQPPSFTASLDQRHGVVRARGHLDVLAADLLRGSIVALQRRGHRQITVRLEPLATADDAAREVLARLAGTLAAEGVRLVVE
jgi:anti-anti-sigma regulatory factor